MPDANLQTASQSQSSSPADLFAACPTTTGGYDERADVLGRTRPHWDPLVQSLQRLGPAELVARWDDGRRIIREHGVTYNVYGDPMGMDRPWALDLVPLVIPATDWSRIEAGLIQRSRLLNLILTDLYAGAQRLLRDGFLPPELVYANPGFLRPCRGIAVTNQVYLHLHACDLARAPDGRWWVLADRTQAPSGAGYAHENRTVLSRILPEEIRESGVRRISGFFQAERAMLYSLATTSRDNPGVVLLTPGPHNETYFEHAYLARHLGIPLVEGADLSVRDRRVFLKTLEGLQPVDVILRRVDDSFCDPLELRADSFLGVPGLVEATRAGHVTLANALGTGLLESPGFLAFLPALCRHLLDEDLILPSVATWWCGQADELRHVTENLEQLVVKPAFGRRRGQMWVGADLATHERQKLVDAILARPRDYVGQERALPSRAPVWVGNRFEPRSVVLRTYAATNGSEFAVMPGGLTRVAPSPEDTLVSMQHGSGSKDTWVMPDRDHAAVESPARATSVRAGDRISSGLPSRAADNLFWLGRYTERLEQTLRVLRCVIGRLSDEGPGQGIEPLTALIELLDGLGVMPGRHAQHGPAAELQHRVLQIVYKPASPGTVRDLLGRIRYSASTVRDRFSGDTWRILGRLDLDAAARPGRLPLANALALIHNLVLDLAAFNGMEMENMTRGFGWRFLDFGRRLERALAITRLITATASVRTRPDSVLESVLEMADSVMTYRRRHFAAPRLPGVLELLVRDASNPRALAFQIDVLREHLQSLPSDPHAPIPEAEAARIADLAHRLVEADFADSIKPGPDGVRRGLLDLMDVCAVDLTALSDDLTQRYFSHTLPRVS